MFINGHTSERSVLIELFIRTGEYLFNNKLEIKAKWKEDS